MRSTRFSAVLATLCLALAPSLTLACEKLEETQSGVKRSLRAPVGIQEAEFTKLRNGASFMMELHYRSEGGAPYATRDEDGPYAVLPREYFLPLTAWADALALCAVDDGTCSRLGRYAQAYRDTAPGTQIPFLPSLIDEPDEACETRYAPRFVETFKVAYASAILTIQMHEIAHGLLGHLAPGAPIVGPREEAHADAFARFMLEFMDDTDGFSANWSAVAVLPLMRRDYQSGNHPDLVCRVRYLSGGNLDLAPVLGPTDCSRYLADTTEGEALANALIGPETVLSVRP